MSRSKIISMIAGTVIVIGAIISIFVIDWGTEVAEAPPPIRPLKTMVIESAVERGMREYPGRVDASQRVDLAFRVSGPLIELPVSVGQEVAVGDVLARIDPRDFRIRLTDITSKIEVAQANLAAMRSGRPEDIAKLEAEVQKAEAARSLAASEYELAKRAFDRQAMTELELEKRLEMRLRREAEFKQAEQNLQIGRTGARVEDIDAAEANIRGLQAQRDDVLASLDDTELRAPFAGVVAMRFVENFEFVDVRQPIVSLQDVSSVEVIINIPEADLLTHTTQGAYDAFAVFEGVPDRRFEVTLKEFATDADPATQTYEITLMMPAPTDLNILAGMTATVHVYPKAMPEDDEVAYAVPFDAVPVDSGGTYYVWKLTPAEGEIWTVHRSDVVVGDLTGDKVVVTAGLAKGDRIAVAGIRILREGQQVRLLESGAPSS